MSDPERLRVHPHQRLSEVMQHVDLVDAAAQLRAELHASTHGHRQITIARQGPVVMLLFVFERDGVLKTHRTDGAVTIHVLNGELEVTVESGPVVVRNGELVALAPGQDHAVRAMEASEMLLTVCHTSRE